MSKVILITGANRGLGYAIAQAIAQRSKDVCILVASRRISSAEEAVSTLQNTGINAVLVPIALDVTNDESIRTCLREIDAKYGRLDILINNAGIAATPTPSSNPTEFREAYSQTFNTNITSVALLTTHSMPLLLKSPNPNLTAENKKNRNGKPRVINISSARASLHALTTGALPPTASVPYSISKTALNVLTIEMGKAWPEVEFYAASPGHCRTALNGFRGKRKPADGARVVVELALAEEDGRFKGGFWECNDEGVMQEVEW